MTSIERSPTPPPPEYCAICKDIDGELHPARLATEHMAVHAGCASHFSQIEVWFESEWVRFGNSSTPLDIGI